MIPDVPSVPFVFQFRRPQIISGCLKNACLDRHYQATTAVHMVPLKGTHKAVMDVFKDVFETRKREEKKDLTR